VRLIQTDELTPTGLKSQTERDIVYNAMDVLVTLEVLEALLPQLDDVTAGSYQRSLDLQGPVLQMNMRGTRIDIEARSTARRSSNCAITFTPSRWSITFYPFGI
jgi:hypothetical protein